MSMEDLNRFMKMAEEDAAVAARVEGIGYEDIPGLIAYARELGLSVDAEDFEEMKKHLLSERRELDDEELGAVAGGWLFRVRRRRRGGGSWNWFW
jgi:predicted ribosomally synthesized peptide with nif11-like leader